MKPRRPLNDIEISILSALNAAKEIVPHWLGWLTPMYFGGTDGSKHSELARRLARLGLVRTQNRGGYTRGSRVYRITKAGRVELRKAIEARNTPKKSSITT